MKKLLMCGIVLVTAMTVRADVQYTTEMSMMKDGKMTPFSTTTTWMKAGLMRMDSQQDLGMVRQSESTVTRCAKREQLRFDPNLKIYTVSSLNSNGAVGGGAAGGAGGGKTGTGKIIMTASVKFVNREKVAGRMARHYRISQRMQMSGCVGNSDTSFKSEIWVADAALPTVSCGPASGDWKQAFTSSNCKMSFEQRGDWKAFQAAYKGLVMKSITFDAAGKPTSQMRITNLSFANLNPKSFDAPAGFKKESSDEYDKTRRDAMIAAMTKGA